MLTLIKNWFKSKNQRRLDEINSSVDGFSRRLEANRDNWFSEMEKTFELSLEQSKAIMDISTLQEQGDHEKALKALKALEQKYSNDEGIQDYIIGQLTDMGKTAEALAAIENRYKGVKPNIRKTAVLSRVYRIDNQLDAAEKTIDDKAEKTMDADLLFELGVVKLLKGDYVQAEILLQKLSRRFTPQRQRSGHWVYAHLAVAQHLQGKTTEAEKSSSYAIKVIREIGSGTHIDEAYLALALAAGGQAAEAKAKWQSLKPKVPKGLADCFERIFELM